MFLWTSSLLASPCISSTKLVAVELNGLQKLWRSWCFLLMLRCLSVCSVSCWILFVIAVFFAAVLHLLTFETWLNGYESESCYLFIFLVCLFLTPQHGSLWPDPSRLCPPGFCLWRRRRLAHKLHFSFRDLLTMPSASFILYWICLLTSGFLWTNQYRNQKELYCQVCLHTQGICLGVRSFQYRKYKHSADNI